MTEPEKTCKAKLRFVAETLSVSNVDDDEHVELFLQIGDQGAGVYVGLSYEKTRKDPELMDLFCFDSEEMVDEFATKIKELLRTSKY